MRTLVLLGCLVSFGCDDDTTPTRDMAIPSDMAVGNATVARGEYLVKHVLLCGDCHTTPNVIGMPSNKPADFLAGGRMFNVGSKAVYAKNLTPDVMTGIGSWSLSQIKDAIRTGIDDQGMPLFPIMPYWEFHNLTDDDATSIALYLQSVPPQKHLVPEDTITVPMAANALPDSMIPHTTLATSDPDYASAERGRYLAELACIDCHTPHNVAGAGAVLDLARAFAGGHTFDIGGITTTVSANITPDATGLAGWSVMDIAQTLETDQERGTGRLLCPPMPGGSDELGGLTAADLTDVANYIHTLPPIANGPFGCNDAGVPYNVPDGG